jgi:hypothetical protein
MRRHLFVVLVGGGGTKLICNIVLYSVQNIADVFCRDLRKCVVFDYRVLICRLSTEAVRNSDCIASSGWILITGLWKEMVVA